MKRLTKQQAIRVKCLDCSCGSTTEVKECPITRCALWRYRLGKEERDDLYQQAMKKK